MNHTVDRDTMGDQDTIEQKRRRARFPLVHIVLFVLTIFSTLAAGMIQKGINPLAEPWKFYAGVPFSATLIIILLSHELSHYFTSRWHKTIATLPYFIPAPTLIGTFGAVIRMKSPIMSRRALIDIGASGPIMGFLFSMVACVVGLHLSTVIRGPHPAGGAAGVTLGDSIIFYLLSRFIVGNTSGAELLLHPIAFAGWIGLFVTFLNLLPVGQLDGGHVAFAFFGRVHKVVSGMIVALLAVLGIFFWKGWLVWAALMLILGLRHPPVYYWETPLDPARRYVGAAVLLIFILTFVPTPFTI
ncbi:MAG: site-2 protease family protein [Nitrospiraceae bacterium]|nr:site-2 protease family protein [Nitrospiraceae bacterium]